jgi:hypothetical protein
MPSTTTKTTTTPNSTTPPTDWQHVAEAEAAVTDEWGVVRPRGVVPCALGDAVVVYSTAPYVGHPGLREEGWGLLRRWLADHRIPELGFAAYPTSGRHAGRTQVMVIAAGDDRLREVEAAVARIHEYALDRLWEDCVDAYGRPVA